MIHIDKSDELYKYLLKLGVEDVEKEYINLAENGRYKLNDVRQYFREKFHPSNTEEVLESDLEKVLDYYVDLKQVKNISVKDIKTMLKEYKQTQNKSIRDQIISSQLKDVMYLCLNYKTLHKNVDIQDLIQIANLGLIDAIEKYDTNANLDLKDYIVYWIREKIIKEFEEKEKC